MWLAAGVMHSWVGLLTEVCCFAAVFDEADYVVLGGLHAGMELLSLLVDDMSFFLIGGGCVMGIGGSISWCFAGRCCWMGQNRVENERRL